MAQEWRDFCKAYAQQYGLTYAQSMSMCKPAYQQYKKDIEESRNKELQKPKKSKKEVVQVDEYKNKKKPVKEKRTVTKRVVEISESSESEEIEYVKKPKKKVTYKVKSKPKPKPKKKIVYVTDSSECSDSE